jgi:hypothetical protein
MEILSQKLNASNFVNDHIVIEIGIICLKLAVIRLLIENEDAKLYLLSFMKIVSAKDLPNLYVYLISLVSIQEKPNLTIFN